jgi:hypothetical protein
VAGIVEKSGLRPAFFMGARTFKKSRSPRSPYRAAMEFATRYPAAMDIHPPHSPIHSWRDFLIHLGTIAAGLVIALGFEAVAENLHHRHLVAEARHNLRREIVDNHKLYAENLVEVQAARVLLQKDIEQLRDMRAGRMPPQLDLHWRFLWNSYTSAAWDTARDAGAVPFMSLDTIEEYSGLYGQQTYVNEAGVSILLAQTKAGAPLRMVRDAKDPKEYAPIDVQSMLAASAELDIRLQTLQNMMKGLDDEYVKALQE